MLRRQTRESSHGDSRTLTGTAGQNCPSTRGFSTFFHTKRANQKVPAAPEHNSGVYLALGPGLAPTLIVKLELTAICSRQGTTATSIAVFSCSVSFDMGNKEEDEVANAKTPRKAGMCLPSADSLITECCVASLKDAGRWVIILACPNHVYLLTTGLNHRFSYLLNLEQCCTMLNIPILVLTKEL